MNNQQTTYTPQFFLAALGNGGLTVSLYMYLMFLVKHAGFPMANFEHLYPVITGSNYPVAIATALVSVGIIYFAFRHFSLLLWNLKQFSAFKASENFESFKTGKNALSLMTIPLTLAMSVNVAFILGGAFIPNLWSIVEYLFPFALIAFGLIGFYAFKTYIDITSPLLIKGGLANDETNHFSRMISSFAFAMVAVGFSASAAMSHMTLTHTIGFIGAVFFSVISVGVLLVEFAKGIRGVFSKGLAFELSHSIWIMIPILTILGITIVRLTAAVSHNLLQTAMPAYFLFIVLSVFFSIQIIFGIVGYRVMKDNGYFRTFVKENHSNPGSYALICPGVAAFVMGMFFIGWGLIETGIMVKYSYVHLGSIALLAIIQYKTIRTMFTLDKKYFAKDNPVVMPASQ